MISLAAERFTKNLWTEKPSSERPRLVMVRDETEQANYIVEKVLEAREAGQQLKQQAVLFRTSHHSGPLEIELTRRNIPFVKFGGLKFLDSAHVKDLLALLRFAQNPRDRVAGFRLLQLLPGVGPAMARKTLDAMAAAADPLAALAAFPAPPRLEKHWPDFLATMRNLRENKSNWPAELFAARVWYEPHLERLHEDAITRKLDLVQLEQIAATYPSREKFLTELTLDPPDATSAEAGIPLRDEDYLILSTIHSAKGQEWKSVFLLNVVDGCIPSDLATGASRRNRGGAPPALCRHDASQGSPASADAAAFFHPWPARLWRPPCLCRAQPFHPRRTRAAIRNVSLAAGRAGRRPRRGAASEDRSERPDARHVAVRTAAQCAVQTMQGSKERTTCWIAGALAPASPTSTPTRACSSGPGTPAASRGEKFQVVGATI